MPLYLRAMRDHYPDADSRDAGTMNGFVALSGSYACGQIVQSRMTHSEHLLDWACGFSGFSSGGTVAMVEEAKPAMAKAFRDSLARVGLAEIEDAEPGPPVRETPQSDVVEAWVPGPPLSDLDHPVVIHQPRRMAVRSGELLVSLLYEINRAPYAGQWTWPISGTRPNPKEFIWNGHEPRLAAAQAALVAAWGEWLRWAGLRQREPLRWGSE